MMNHAHLWGMRHLPMSALRVFEAAGRTGSFKAAGDELAISPSAVSHAIRKLEDAMGAALFEREGRAVRLTPGGEVLFHSVSEAFDGIRHGMELVGARSQSLLRVHCAPSMATQWLMPRLRHLLEANPGLEVRLSADTSYARFQNDEFDLDISYGPPRQEGLVSIPLGDERVTPLCAPDLAARIKTASDLLDLELIESEHKRVRWQTWFEANGLSAPAPRGNRFDRSFMAIAAAVDRLGVALESTRLAEREIADGRLVAPLCGVCDVCYPGHVLVLPRRALQRRVVRLFIDWMLDELGLPSNRNERTDAVWVDAPGPARRFL